MLYGRVLNGKQIIRLLKKHGWELDRVAGSHHILKKWDKTLTVPVHGKKNLPKGTLLQNSKKRRD